MSVTKTHWFFGIKSPCGLQSFIKDVRTIHRIAYPNKPTCEKCAVSFERYRRYLLSKGYKCA